MRRIIVVCFVLFGCNSQIQEQQLNQLNGYWEITEVEFPNGQTKAYTVNTTIDFIKIEGLSGFRKKVQPRLNGSYETSDDAEEFIITQRNGVFLIRYGSDLQEWEEEILEIGENAFSVRNEDAKIYKYKRFEPINLTP